MKTLALTLSLLALLAPQAFADQYEWIESEEVARAAAASIHPGEPLVYWVSHMDGSEPTLMVARNAEASEVPGAPYWQVTAEVRPIAMREGGKWVPKNGAAYSPMNLDLAYVYVPRPSQNRLQRRFRNLADRLDLPVRRRRRFGVVVPVGPMKAAFNASSRQVAEEEIGLPLPNLTQIQPARTEQAEAANPASDQTDSATSASDPANNAATSQTAKKIVAQMEAALRQVMAAWLAGGKLPTTKPRTPRPRTLKPSASQGALGGLDALDASSTQDRPATQDRPVTQGRRAQDRQRRRD